MSSKGLTEAIRLLKAEKRKPTDADRPPPRPLPGPRIKVLPGQLALGQDVESDEPATTEEGTTTT